MVNEAASHALLLTEGNEAASHAKLISEVKGADSHVLLLPEADGIASQVLLTPMANNAAYQALLLPGAEGVASQVNPNQDIKGHRMTLASLSQSRHLTLSNQSQLCHQILPMDLLPTSMSYVSTPALLKEVNMLDNTSLGALGLAFIF